MLPLWGELCCGEEKDAFECVRTYKSLAKSL